MGFLNFGSRIKHRKFDYIPRYYDPAKEELEQRLKRYKREGDEKELLKERIRGGFKRKYSTSSTTGAGAQRNKILLLIIVILCALTYILLTKHLPLLIKLLE